MELFLCLQLSHCLSTAVQMGQIDCIIYIYITGAVRSAIRPFNRSAVRVRTYGCDHDVFAQQTLSYRGTGKQALAKIPRF